MAILADSSSGSEAGEKDHSFSKSINFPKISKPRARYTRPWSASASYNKPISRRMYQDAQPNIRSPRLRVNLARLGVEWLCKYCRHYKLQRLSETQVIINFVRAAKRLKPC